MATTTFIRITRISSGCLLTFSFYFRPLVLAWTFVLIKWPPNKIQGERWLNWCLIWIFAGCHRNHNLSYVVVRTYDLMVWKDHPFCLPHFDLVQVSSRPESFKVSSVRAAGCEQLALDDDRHKWIWFQLGRRPALVGHRRLQWTHRAGPEQAIIISRVSRMQTRALGSLSLVGRQ